MTRAFGSVHRRPESLRLREPRVSRGIYSRAREAFEALLARRQPGHRRRSDAEELWSAEATGRRMAGAAVVNGFGKAADLPGVHRGRTGFPKHLARRVHDLYFQPVHEEFQARTMWSLSNAFTSAFKELEPIPQYKATAKLAGFLQSVRPALLAESHIWISITLDSVRHRQIIWKKRSHDPGFCTFRWHANNHLFGWRLFSTPTQQHCA
jgi:hypothetical protein